MNSVPPEVHHNYNGPDRKAVQQHSPASRSAPRVNMHNMTGTPTGFNKQPQNRANGCSTPLGLAIDDGSVPGVRCATPGYVVERLRRWYVITAAVLLVTALTHSTANAHEGHSHAPSPETQQKIVQLNTAPPKHHFVVFQNAAETTAPELAKLFEPFKKTVNVRFDRDFLYVESTGMPAHPMMTGITAWQQQVPLPQSYTGNNAWRIPLHPVPAKNPMSTKEHFFRGAIALAVNGVPIFNPIKNDGKTDTLKAGELDQWGGHCGRADDYHYHIAPVHLEKIVGVDNPVAVALDGYPIYGYNDPNGKPPTNLDWLNGHIGPDGEYHYHATKTFPYLNGGFYGEVVERDGQVDPQPRAQGVRPSLPGLRGAKIVGFENPKEGSFIVRYEVFGDPRSVEYTVADNGLATFNFVSAQGTKTENYTPRQRGGGDGRRNAERPTVPKMAISIPRPARNAKEGDGYKVEERNRQDCEPGTGSGGHDSEGSACAGKRRHR